MHSEALSERDCEQHNPGHSLSEGIINQRCYLLIEYVPPGSNKLKSSYRLAPLVMQQKYTRSHPL